MRKETNLQAVKKVAQVLLCLDIVKTAYSPLVVQHPFTNTGVTAIRKNGELEIVDLTQSQEGLDAWTQSVSEQIEAAESASDVTMLLNKAYGLTFLKYAEPHLSREDFSNLLSEAWVMAEAPNSDVNVNKRRLVEMFRHADQDMLMDEGERDHLADLDNPVTVYRGVTPYNEKNVRALSWTLDKETAEWFAHRYDQEGTVYEAQIEKKHILALFHGRSETEVIVDPKQLMEISQVPCEQIRSMTMEGL